jgi:hypothetical protein
MEPPGLCTNRLNQQRITPSSIGHHLKSLFANRAPGHFNRLLNRASDVLPTHDSERVPIGSSQKRQNVVIHHAAYRRRQSGSNECEFPPFAEGMFNGRGKIPQFADLSVMHLVEL